MPEKRRPRAKFTDHTGRRVRMHLDPHTGEYVRYAHQLTTLDHKGNIVPRKTKDPSLLIIDASTSGFKADSVILEIAALLVDCRPPYEIIDTFSMVVAHAAGTLEHAPPFHRPLVLECYAANPDGQSLAHVEGALLAGEWTSAGAVLDHDCGFTLKFLERLCPTLYRALPRCRVDLDGVELLLKNRGVPAYPAPLGGRSYRAADDIVDAYEQLIWWLETAPAPASRVVPS